MAFTKNPLTDGTKKKLSDYSQDLETRIFDIGVGIVDFDSNENGNWYRFENGLQVCFHRRNDGAKYHTFVPELNSARTGGLEWVYPKTFITEPAGFVNGAVLGVTRYTEGHSYSNSNFQYRWINHEQNSSGTYDTGIVSFLAIGRWK